MPSEQVKELLRKARSIALTECECRAYYKRCDKPLEVCFLLDKAGDKFVEKGLARHITKKETDDVLRKANENGLVHLCLYMPDKKVYAVCSCCACCCHEFQIVKQYQRRDLMVKSDYVAETNIQACIHCGACAERCLFDARHFKNSRLVFNAALCAGCGLCVTTCPAECTTLKPRRLKRENPY
ncbi:MAG: hypothetical protein JXB26_02825 [Candidatus Aminicenantes bacterium]|nr:hypothetical protein [Candidatus Aminicenantes bacterium]